MRRLLLVPLIAVLALSFAGVASLAAPTIQFEKTTLDVGSMRELDKTKVSFPFKNTGDATLTIVSVEASCGCTDAKATVAKVAPGKSSAIEAVFNPAGKSGKVEMTITVTTNDPTNPEVILQFTGEVIPIARLAPKQLDCGTLKPGQTFEQTVVVTPTEPKSFKILKINPDGTHVSAPEFRRARDNKGTYYVKVLVKAGDTTGRVYEHLSMVTDLPGSPTVSLLVYGNVSDQDAENAKPS